MKTQVYSPPRNIEGMHTAELRDQFLLEDLFQSGAMRLAYFACDRLIVGGVIPDPQINVVASDDIHSSFFNERRETGLINIGGPGMVSVDGKDFAVGHLECLYVGAGAKSINFKRADSVASEFYLLSCPAHTNYPTRLIRRSEAAVSLVGDSSNGSQRKITRYIHEAGVKSCQLVMGFTELEPGNVWNTWPPHTHLRRSEVYLYFDLGAGTVVHLLGEASATRHLIVRNRQAVLSPPWSIHCGVGTLNYRFVWGMAGENQTFEDMDAVNLSEFK